MREQSVRDRGWYRIKRGRRQVHVYFILLADATTVYIVLDEGG
jgi:hypothetical protein